MPDIISNTYFIIKGLLKNNKKHKKSEKIIVKNARL